MNLFYILIAAIFCHAAMASNCTLVKTTSVISIPSDYINTTGIGFHKYYPGPKNWDEARAICVNDGAHLAVIDSDDELKALNKMKNSTFKYTWIGIHDMYETSYWNTVLDEPVTYVSWIEGNPDHKSDEQCGSFGTLGLNSYGCTRETDFVCEINV